MEASAGAGVGVLKLLGAGAGRCIRIAANFALRVFLDAVVAAIARGAGAKLAGTAGLFPKGFQAGGMLLERCVASLLSCIVITLSTSKSTSLFILS